MLAVPLISIQEAHSSLSKVVDLQTMSVISIYAKSVISISLGMTIIFCLHGQSSCGTSYQVAINLHVQRKSLSIKCIQVNIYDI